ncbi:hypothetical protein C8J57DRAFT_1211818 [Mycena rebaudengoi]|nr:hypothetical protein C8J57DRAFT_1211818 [Mycena rebaudengoi]
MSLFLSCLWTSQILSRPHTIEATRHHIASNPFFLCHSSITTYSHAQQAPVSEQWAVRHEMDALRDSYNAMALGLFSEYYDDFKTDHLEVFGAPATGHMSNWSFRMGSPNKPRHAGFDPAGKHIKNVQANWLGQFIPPPSAARHPDGSFMTLKKAELNARKKRVEDLTAIRNAPCADPHQFLRSSPTRRKLAPKGSAKPNTKNARSSRKQSGGWLQKQGRHTLHI